MWVVVPSLTHRVARRSFQKRDLNPTPFPVCNPLFITTCNY